MFKNIRAHKVCNLIVNISLLLPNISISTSLENQVANIENRKDIIRHEIDTRVYDIFIKNAKVTVSNPEINKITGDAVEIHISVRYTIDISKLQEIDKSISQYISADITAESIASNRYELTYDIIRRRESIYSEMAWNSLSKEALGIEANFIGKKEFRIVIGQTNGLMGSILEKDDIIFKFIIPKRNIKGDPKPTISFVKYKCAWDISNPKYWKLSSYEVPKDNLIINY